MPGGDLSDYDAKREFEITPEPGGGRKPASHGPLSFVVQKHAASRLHYDLRLELDGTYLSWAVPKGPSFDPSEKRLAMRSIVVRRNSMMMTDRGGPTDTFSVARCRK